MVPGVSGIVFFCWISVFDNTFIGISRPTPENVYLDKNSSIVGGLEARTQIWAAIL